MAASLRLRDEPAPNKSPFSFKMGRKNPFISPFCSKKRILLGSISLILVSLPKTWNFWGIPHLPRGPDAPCPWCWANNRLGFYFGSYFGVFMGFNLGVLGGVQLLFSSQNCRSRCWVGNWEQDHEMEELQEQFPRFCSGKSTPIAIPGAAPRALLLPQPRENPKIHPGSLQVTGTRTEAPLSPPFPPLCSGNLCSQPSPFVLLSTQLIPLLKKKTYLN